MVTNDSIQRELGRIEAQQTSQDQALVDIKAQMAALSVKIDMLIAAENSRSGGGKYLLLLLTVAASAGAIIDRLITWIKVV